MGEAGRGSRAAMAVFIGVREAMRQGPFRLAVDSERPDLALHAGDLVLIDPASHAQPGDAVLANCQRQGKACAVLMRMNGDRDLTAAGCGYVPAGEYAVVGVVAGIERGPRR